MNTTDEDLTAGEGYAAWAAIYDEDGNPLTAIEGPSVRSWLGTLAGRRVIDLGCGTGRHTEALVEAGAAGVFALDPTPAMMDRARQKLRGRPVHWVRHALPAPLPFRQGTFDLAVLGLVIEHVAAVGQAMAEVARVLVPGGRCLVSALHPDRTAEGQRARFVDPETGRRRSIVTYHRTTADYLAVAAAVGLVLVAEEVLKVPAALGERLPRALPYVGQNLGWLACWSKPHERQRTGADGRPRSGL